MWLGPLKYNTIQYNTIQPCLCIRHVEFLTEAHKYVDDMTATESIAPTAVGYEHQTEPGVQITNVYHAPFSELNLHSLSEYCNSSGLKVNEAKTQLLAINSNK